MENVFLTFVKYLSRMHIMFMNHSLPIKNDWIGGINEFILTMGTSCCKYKDEKFRYRKHFVWKQ